MGYHHGMRSNDRKNKVPTLQPPVVRTAYGKHSLKNGCKACDGRKNGKPKVTGRQGDRVNRYLGARYLVTLSPCHPVTLSWNGVEPGQIVKNWRICRLCT